MSDKGGKEWVAIRAPVPRERDERDFKVAEVMRQVRCGVVEFTHCPTRPVRPEFCEGCPEKGQYVDEGVEEFS